MEHIAIMKKSWGLLPKIISGEKTIESRWYKTKCEAWGRVKPGDTVYFKDSGESVSLRAKVAKVIEFSGLTPSKVREILKKYGGNPSAGGGIGLGDFDYFYDWVKNKKYCVLIFLKDIKSIKPFKINKAGFGSARAWITIKNIKGIKIA